MSLKYEPASEPLNKDTGRWTTSRSGSPSCFSGTAPPQHSGIRRGYILNLKPSILNRDPKPQPSNPKPYTSLAGAVHSGLTLVPIANVQYGGFLVFAYFRAALFGITLSLSLLLSLYYSHYARTNPQTSSLRCSSKPWRVSAPALTINAIG